jgi:HK97 family phage major capsid protein
VSDRDLPAGVADLLAEIKSTRDTLERSEQQRIAKIEAKADRSELRTLVDEIQRKTEKLKLLEVAVDALSRKVNRPGGGVSITCSPDTGRDAARALCEQKFLLRVPKNDPSGKSKFHPTEAELDEAANAIAGFKAMLKTVDVQTLPDFQRKALTSFQLGSSGYILPPEMGSEILSCLVSPTDVAGLTNSIQISGPSIRYLVDNVQFGAAWVCEVDCWNAARVADLTSGLSEIEVKAEELRSAPRRFPGRCAALPDRSAAETPRWGSPAGEELRTCRLRYRQRCRADA